MSLPWLFRRVHIVGFVLVLVLLSVFAPGPLLAAWQNSDLIGGTSQLTNTAPACSLVGDLNADGVINVRDMQAVADLWQLQLGHRDYNPEYDLNGDEHITVADTQIVSGQWGNNCGVLSPVEVTITPAEGGGLVSVDGRVHLTVPPLAVDSPVTIRYQQLHNRYVPGYKSTEFFFELTARDAQGQLVTHFDRYLDLTVGYSEIEGLDESKFILSYTQDDTHWRPLHLTRDTDTNQISARLEHFTTFAVFGDTPYEVGVGPGVPPNVTDAFRAAYQRNGGEDSIGLPESEVHDWPGAWVQDFDWASIVFNPSTGSAYYIQGEYISKYVNADGPNGFLKLPVSDRANPPADALLSDKHTDFMGDPVQQFDGGFIGKDTNGSEGGGHRGAYYYPVLTGATVEVEHYTIPDPNDPDETITKARVTLVAQEVLPNPPQNDKGVSGIWVESDNPAFRGMMPSQGTAPKVWENLDPQDEFAFRLEAWADTGLPGGQAGYLPCDSYKKQQNGEEFLKRVSLASSGFYSWGYECAGFGGGGGGGGFADRQPPVIGEPEIWQNGMGWAVIQVEVTDNVGVAWVKFTLNGEEILATLWQGNTYAAVVKLKLGKNTFVIDAADHAGNTAHKPESGFYEIWSTMDGVFGNRPWMGYSDDPVNSGIGNFIYSSRDATVPAQGPDMLFERWFNHQSRFEGAFGIGWTFSYDIQLSVVDNLLFSGVQVRYPDGHTENYTGGEGGFTPPPGSEDELEAQGDGYVLTTKNKTIYRFNAEGRLISIEDSDGNKLTLSYGGETLSQLIDASGRVITFAYSDSKITSITIPDYGSLEFTYSDGRLATATDTKGNQAQYTYDADGNIINITSPNGNPFLAEQEYDEQGRVTFQRGGTGFINKLVYDDDAKTTTIEDAYGNITTHIYDDEYRLIELQDALGYSEKYTYDEQFRKLTTTDKNGYTTTYTYDEQGNLLSVTDPLGGVTTYAYDTHDNVISKTDPLGNIFSYIYDDEHHLISSTDPLGALVEHTYNADGLLVSTTDALGNRTETAYNALGLPVSITDALGNVSTIEYDAAGQLLSQTDASGNTATYQYNSLGLVESVTDPEGYVTTYEYDADRNLVRETNADGGTKHYTFDENGRLVAETDWAGYTTTYTYDDLGRLIAQTDALSNSVISEYDAVGSLIAKTDKRGAKTTYSYDPNRNMLSETNALGEVTSYSYDELNRVVEISHPCACASRVEHMVYDALGRVIEQIDPLGNHTYFEFDALGREIKRTDALGFQTSKVYDLVGNLSSEIDALGNATHYTYDALNRVVQVTNRLGYTTSQEYDASGRQIASTNERGYTAHSVYDGNNRLIESRDALGNVTRYTYDGRGNRLTTTDALGRVVTSTYDANSNLIRVVNARDYDTAYEYDALNRQVKVIDALGGVTTFTFDAEGALLAETDPASYTQQTTYDLLGRPVATTNRNGFTTTSEYDPAGNLIRTVDALGGVTRRAFDANNNLVTETNALGARTSYTYDALNRQIKVVDALGGVSTRSYDALGRLSEEVDANGHPTSYTYDAEGHRLTRTDALKHTALYEYDAAGNLIKETDRNGHSTYYVYDALNRQVRLTNALGHNQTTEHDAVGNIVQKTNFRGYTTRSEYDPNNNLHRIIDALDGVTSYTYDPLDRRTSVTDANTHTTLFGYDAVGNQLSKTLPEGQVSSYTYDGEGNSLSFTNARGYTTSYVYDALNRQIREIDPLNHETVTVYDAIGQTIQVIDANQNATSRGYDLLGRLVVVTDALNYPTAYTYDAVGNRLTKTDANGHTTRFDYDAEDRLVRETNPLGASWDYTYDPEGNLIQREDANRVVTRYDFDEVNQLIAVHYQIASQDVRYTYDPNGNLIEIIDPIGTTTLTYDALDREVSKVDPYERSLVNSYDAVGNRLSITYPEGHLVRYSYNKNNWLVTMDDPRNGSTQYEYEADGQVRLVDFPNKTWSTSEYDPASRLVSVFNGTSYHDGVITGYKYTLDPVGNRLEVEETYTQGQIRTNIKRYTYTTRYEVQQAVEEYEGPPPYTVTTHYTYDPVGNRLTMTTDRDTGPGPQPDPVTTRYRYDAADRMVAAGDTSLTYDANGNRLTKVVPAKPPAQTRLEEYSYDIENRLTGYTRTRVQSGHIEQRVYSYFDGLGRRLNKGAQESSGTIKWSQYTLDGLSYNQLVEYPQTGHPRVRELYRGVQDQLVSMDEIQGDGVGSQYWFATDGLASVTATTKQNGQSSHEFFYDPYGQLIDENGHWEDSSSWTDPHNHYLLSGEEWDEESRLYYFGARFYDAEMGIWLTQDPYRGEIKASSSLHGYLHLGHNPPVAADQAHNPMSLHRYLYVQNNPLNRVDPLGFFNWVTGLVEQDDTLYQISKDAGVSIADIVRWNPHIEHPDKIYVDMYLWLPEHARNTGLAVYAERTGNKGESSWGKQPPVPPYARKYAFNLTLKERAERMCKSLNRQHIRCELGEMLRPRSKAHLLSTAHHITNGEITVGQLKELQDGKDKDGTLWFKKEWVNPWADNDIPAAIFSDIANNARRVAEKEDPSAISQKWRGLIKEVNYAREGYEPSDVRRLPNSKDVPVSTHVYGNAIDVDIAWEHFGEPWSNSANKMVTSFGLDRPISKAYGVPDERVEPWHFELHPSSYQCTSQPMCMEY